MREEYDNQKRIFFYKGQLVQVIEDNGKLFFVAQCITQILGYQSTARYVKNLGEGTYKKISVIFSGRDKPQNVYLLTLRGLSRLCAKKYSLSKSSESGGEHFLKWLENKVLPLYGKTLLDDRR